MSECQRGAAELTTAEGDQFNYFSRNFKLVLFQKVQLYVPLRQLKQLGQFPSFMIGNRSWKARVYLSNTVKYKNKAFVQKDLCRTHGLQTLRDLRISFRHALNTHISIEELISRNLFPQKKIKRFGAFGDLK